MQTNIALEAIPQNPEHLVPMWWVEDFVTGKTKAAVEAVATTDQAGTYTAATKTFVYTAAGPLDIDDVTLAVGERVLFAGQTDQTQNGIYEVADAGNGGPAELVRASDFDDPSKIENGVRVPVTGGTLEAGTTWKLDLPTGTTVVLDSTALPFVKHEVPTSTRKHAETIDGDDTTTDFVINHGLSTDDVSVTIRNLATKAIVLADVTFDDQNNLTIGFFKAPDTGHHYRVTVIG